MLSGGRATALQPADRPQDPAAAPQEPAPPGPTTWGNEETRSHLIPALEIVGFEFLLNRFDRNFAADAEAYEVSADTVRNNLKGGWAVDKDPFGVNQLGHPYTGSIYHAFARSSGLGFWEAAGYTFAGSLLWEIAGENTNPSINDQIHTGIGGAFLGEAFFRTASWLLEGPAPPNFASNVGAILLSPPTMFNRWAFGDRFDGVFPSNQPAVFSRVGFGGKFDIKRDQDGGLPDVGEEAASLVLQFAIDYGLPGKAGYRYERPFDYFHFEVSGLTEKDNHCDRAIVRGLIAPLGEYDTGRGGNGINGLFGSYDYRSPGLFRVATTALSYGTVGQAPVWDGANLQWLALGGIGFGAAGTVADDTEDRDYHHGAVPQVAFDFRLTQSEWLMLQMTVSNYFVIGVASNDGGGFENVAMVDLSATFRISGPHALRVEFNFAQRDSQFDNDPDRHQTVDSIFLLYNFLGGTRFSPVR